jgi:hypothetical protein
MQQTIENPSALSRLPLIGQPMYIGSTQDVAGAFGSPKTMLQVPLGKVFVITKIVLAPVSYLVAYVASPSLGDRTGNGLDIRTSAGNEFTRWQSLFNASAANSWRNAPPNNVVAWKLRTPIAIAPGAIVGNPQDNTYHNTAGAFGYMIDEGEATALGLQLLGKSATEQGGVKSATSTTSAVTLIPAKTGHSIQILNVLARQQPLATAASSTLTLRQSGDSRNVFQFTNGNPANLCQFAFSPQIFLRPGQGLDMLSTTTNTGSAAVHYRYVPEADVPGDHWWACQAPTKPAGTTTKQTTNTAITCYYPKSNTTATTAGTGRQHILEGYALSAQYAATSPVSGGALAAGGVSFRIGAGASGGEIGNSGLLVSNTASGTQMSPIFDLYEHEQTLWVAEDDAMVIAPATNGLFFESLAYEDTIPADGRIRDWFVMAWGRTIPERFTGTTNRGQA